jgi:hypothetical protein
MDFTVFGLARSGTTALANCINLHPHIFCANEFLGPEPSDDIVKSDFPGIFLDKRINLVKAEDNKRVFEKKQSIVKFGNKYPRNYAHLDRWSSSFPCIINIGIYRENLDFMSSWNLRAAEGSWPTGRIGVLGVIEQVSCWGRIIDLGSRSNTYVFSYNRLFRDDNKQYLKLISALNMECSPSLHAQFCKKYFAQKKVFEKKRIADSLGELSRDWFSVGSVDKIFYEYSGKSLSSMEDTEVRFIRDSVVSRLPGFIEHIYPMLGSDSREHLMTMRKLLSGTPYVGVEINALLKRLARQ